MLINKSVVDGAVKRAQGVPVDASINWSAKPLSRDHGQINSTLLKKRAAMLSAGGSRPSATEFERILGDNDLVDEFFLQRALVAAQPVARLVLRDNAGKQRGFASGFMVSPHLLLTNWHVFPQSAEANNGLAQFNYKLDIQGNPIQPVSFLLRPDLYYFSDQKLDYALVAVDGKALNAPRELAEFGYLRLIAEQGKVNPKEWLTIIQHPEGQPRQFSIRESQLLEPMLTEHLWYKSDTAKGSSGSPVFNDSFQIVALHHSGVPKKANGEYVLNDGRKVRSLDGISESDVDWIANEGVRVSVICAHIDARAPRLRGFVGEMQAAMRGGDVLSRAYAAVQQPGGAAGMGPGAAMASPVVAAPGGTAIAGAPLTLQVSFTREGGISLLPAPASGTAAATATPATAAADAANLEKLVEPLVDTDYSNREGYQEDFLGVHLPLPKIADKSACAQLEDGSVLIPYEHFSVALHKKRRVALLTASNTDYAPAMRAFKASRKSLTGLGDSDQEKWVIDRRVPAMFQLPDVFYNKDRQAFDKGHIVRRDDVCWGETLELIQRANGDTFHVTNCSPQVADFNRDVGAYDGIWGMLENSIGKQGKTEKYAIFAGPVFDEGDRKFEGFDDDGKTEVQIPSRFWKVVNVVTEGKLQSFAFILEQDLSSVKFEFDVGSPFVSSFTSIAHLEEVLEGSLAFPDAVHAADQFDTAAGRELLAAHKGELQKKAPAKKPAAQKAAAKKATAKKAPARKAATKKAASRPAAKKPAAKKAAKKPAAKKVAKKPAARKTLKKAGKKVAKKATRRG